MRAVRVILLMKSRLPIRGCHDNDSIVACVQAIHAGQDLVQCVLLLAVHGPHAAGSAVKIRYTRYNVIISMML